ncbi:MAG: uroporphyrinogen-III C-methyltransferase [Lachnospiraceae bacterium]|nr:uroporphyrinogen-III C-methyltransferase [Lachnospiraceae bacterium]
MEGKVWLVGAGPGDRGLFTLKGLEVLNSAEVVVYDALVGDEVLTLIPETAEKINVGKRAGNHLMVQEDISRTLLDHALRGKKVVRLKGGDPFVFGRGGEELELLSKNGVPYEVVPGVTSAFAVPAYNGIPVTHRDFTSSVHIITGHRRRGRDYDIDFEALVRTKGTLIFLMGLASLDPLMKGLLEAGMDPDMPAAVLEKGTTAGQRRVVATVSTLREEADRAAVEAPAIIVVGPVCRLSDQFAWAEKRPLAGKKILVTRPKELVSGLAARLRKMGAEVVELPAIETVPVDPNPLLDDCLTRAFGPGDRLETGNAGMTYGSEDRMGADSSCRAAGPGASMEAASPDRLPPDWLVFTSPTGVRIFMDHFLGCYDIRALGGVRIAAIGEGSARALRGCGLRTDFIPTVYDGQHLGRELAEKIRTESGGVSPVPSAETSDGQTAPAAPGGMSQEIRPLAQEKTPPVRVLIPRAAAGSRELVGELEKAGNILVSDIPTYETRYTKPGIIDEQAMIARGEISCVVFTSSSSVRGFRAVTEGMDLSGLTAVCIGRQTKETADACGMRTTMAKKATLDSLVEAVVELFGSK